jgi:carboxypeptidase Taq
VSTPKKAVAQKTATTQTSAPETLRISAGDARIGELLDLTRELADLSALAALAGWDEETALPDGAAEVRGHQFATLKGLIHDRATNPRLGQLLGELADDVRQPRFSDADRGVVREAGRAYDRATKLPKGLVQEIAQVGTAAFEAWRKARERSDFARFAPWLSRTLALQREVADRYGYQETRYDALLDLYEPGLTTSRVETLFRRVREISVTVLRRIQASGHAVDASCLEGSFPVAKQMALCEAVLRGMGYDFTRGGIARSPHPFTQSFGAPYDVRVTIRPDERFVQAAVMAAVHEGGHAVYEQGISPALARTPVAGGASLGAHESQSRLWENAIGRSEPFWQGQFAAVRRAFPKHFATVDAATFARALNAVAPSLIRVEADEVTYNLHIIIRFELERALISGDVAVETLPRLWNEKYQEYLGITPPNDAEGVLQDIHWSHGSFGYFPTYTLGNLYAAQIDAALRRAFPDFDERLARGSTGGGDFALDWLREHMYVFGAIYVPEELIERVTGEKPNPEYFARYLSEKFARVYDLKR